MSLSIQNPYNHKIELNVIHNSGQQDSIHVQPYATVNLPAGMKVHPNSMVQFPKIRIVDSLAAIE